MNQLEVLRESLGQCDEIILDALIMRNRIVEDIMAYKEANGLQILQPEQEAKQKDWLEKRMEGRRHLQTYSTASVPTVRESRQENFSTTTSYLSDLWAQVSLQSPISLKQYLPWI